MTEFFVRLVLVRREENGLETALKLDTLASFTSEQTALLVFKEHVESGAAK